MDRRVLNKDEKHRFMMMGLVMIVIVCMVWGVRLYRYHHMGVRHIVISERQDEMRCIDNK